MSPAVPEKTLAGSLLSERVAVVAGLGPELGPSIARALAREGARLVLVDASAEALDRVEKQLSDRGTKDLEILKVVGDVTRVADCRCAVERALETFGRIDVLVNNAERAGGRRAAVAEVDLAEWQRAFETDVLGAVQLTQESIPAMRASGGGSIVMLGALESRLAGEQMGALPVARGALLMATQMLARELGRDGIRVNTVVPGWLDGPRLRADLDARGHQTGASRQTMHDQLVAEHALGRLTEADEVADAVVFLASDLACIVTGQSLDVNCGHYFH